MTQSPVPVPRPAATVMLLRPGQAEAYEVYLVRRAATMAFAAGMYAFPGGTVDPRDASTDLSWVAPPNRLGLPEGQRTRHIGAEASHGLWAAPGGTVDLPMLPPTRMTLAQLAESSTVDEAITAAAHRDAVHPVRPRFVDGRLVF